MRSRDKAGFSGSVVVLDVELQAVKARPASKLASSVVVSVFNVALTFVIVIYLMGASIGKLRVTTNSLGSKNNAVCGVLGVCVLTAWLPNIPAPRLHLRRRRVVTSLCLLAYRPLRRAPQSKSYHNDT